MKDFSWIVPVIGMIANLVFYVWGRVDSNKKMEASKKEYVKQGYDKALSILAKGPEILESYRDKKIVSNAVFCTHCGTRCWICQRRFETKILNEVLEALDPTKK